jgi:hypothetical protein
MGRHSHPDELDSEPAAESTTPQPKTTAVADLHFLLRRPGLLVVCLLAAVAPFGSYFAVMVGLHKMHEWALFLGAPMVLAGVLVGALLDRAYARLVAEPRPTAAAPAPVPAPVTGPASVVPVGLGSRSIEGARP